MAKRRRRRKKKGRKLRAIIARTVFLAVILAILSAMVFGLVSLVSFIGSKLPGASLKNYPYVISIRGDGRLRDRVYESFDRESYSEEDFSEMVDESVSAYNEEAGEEAVLVKSLKFSKGMVSLEVEYASVDDYNAFNMKELAIGDTDSLSERVTVDLRSVEGQLIPSGSPQLHTLGEKVAIINDDAVIQTPSDIKAFSGGVELKEGRIAAVSADEAASVLVW